MVTITVARIIKGLWIAFAAGYLGCKNEKRIKNGIRAIRKGLQDHFNDED